MLNVIILYDILIKHVFISSAKFNNWGKCGPLFFLQIVKKWSLIFTGVLA